MATTIISWCLTLSLVGVAVYVYKPDLFSKIIPQAQGTKLVPADTTPKLSNKKPKPKKAPAPKLAEVEKVDSGNDSQNSKKRKIAPTTSNKTAAASGSEKPVSTSQNEEAGLSDKDFAKQFAQAQSGTKLQVPPKQQTSKKDRRASKLAAATSPDPSGFSTEASSTTGRDADDDLTPAESPEARPADTTISKAGDVSDMLEAPAAKPTTLRLTDVSESKPKKVANKAFEPVLSKKKRNEQARKEEQRLAREGSDRIHEAKKQEQLRKARMAAGTSNQTKANAFTAKTNAWQSGTSTAVKTAPAPEVAPFLDTFDPPSSTAGPAHGAVHTENMDVKSANDLKSRAGENVAAAMTASSNREGLSTTERQRYTSEISEEDQIKLLQQQDEEDAWESVTSKKSKRKGKQENDSTSGASSPARAPLATMKPQVNGNKVTKVAGTKKAETVNRFDSIQDKTVDSGLQDAEWEA